MNHLTLCSQFIVHLLLSQESFVVLKHLKYQAFPTRNRSQQVFGTTLNFFAYFTKLYSERGIIEQIHLFVSLIFWHEDGGALRGIHLSVLKNNTQPEKKIRTEFQNCRKSSHKTAITPLMSQIYRDESFVTYFRHLPTYKWSKWQEDKSSKFLSTWIFLAAAFFFRKRKTVREHCLIDKF